MKEATKLPELPRLPKGQGTLIYTHGNKILYRKAIPRVLRHHAPQRG